MGLDFNGSEAHWSYSGFNSFRERLAKCAGIDLRSMEGFDGTKSWDEIKDPLKEFLNHSDCDGLLTPNQMKKIHPRISAIIKTWSKDDWDGGEAAQLVKDMKQLCKQNKNLIFC